MADHKMRQHKSSGSSSDPFDNPETSDRWKGKDRVTTESPEPLEDLNPLDSTGKGKAKISDSTPDPLDPPTSPQTAADEAQHPRQLPSLADLTTSDHQPAESTIYTLYRACHHAFEALHRANSSAAAAQNTANSTDPWLAARILLETWAHDRFVVVDAGGPGPLESFLAEYPYLIQQVKEILGRVSAVLEDAVAAVQGESSSHLVALHGLREETERLIQLLREVVRQILGDSPVLEPAEDSSYDPSLNSLEAV